MAADIRIHDKFISMNAPLRVDQVLPRVHTSVLFIAHGIKLLRSGEFDPQLGNALAHGDGDTLVVNERAGYKGGVKIDGNTTVEGSVRIKGSLIIDGKLRPGADQSTDLVALALELQAQVIDLKKRVAALEKQQP